MNKKWWKELIAYQIYPKSFMDSNGDGIGDIQGIISKLDYLKDLGIDLIWLCPMYKSPNHDNGYDISDYKDILDEFGTMDDFNELLNEVHNRGMKLIIDLVINHTSHEHPWFIESRSSRDNPKRDWYIWREGKGDEEPNNWESIFKGSAWEFCENSEEYYLHLFDVSQADLNWDNKELREEIYKVVNFWIDKGVKGFRLDVINLISKPEKFENDYEGDGRRFYTDGHRIHEYLKELNERTFGKDVEIVTVGEMSSTTIENCIKYSNPKEKELSMVFNFHHLKVDYKDGQKWSLMDFDFIELKKLFNNWQRGMINGGGWNAVFWCNHDQPRVNSRFGDVKKYFNESSKMLATSIHMMSGTPYVYQGEEIGMTNPGFESIEEYRDVESINYFNILKEEGIDEKEIMEILKSKSRDNSRTPVQWNEEKNAGFTTGTPWINIANNYREINVERALENKDSVFYHYKKLIELRKNEDVIAYGDYIQFLEDHPKVYAYERNYNGEKLLVINNFYGEECLVDLSKEIEGLENYNKSILISNYKDSTLDLLSLKLRPYESIVYKLEK